MTSDRNPTTPAFSAEDIARWERAPLAEVIKYVVGVYHVPTRMELDRLVGLLAEAKDAYGSAYPELGRIQEHYLHLVDDLKAHFSTEEKTLFPALLAPQSAAMAAEPVEALDPMRFMRAEHDSAFELLENIRILTGDYTVPSGAPDLIQSLYKGFADLEDSLHRHIYLENHVIFQRVLMG